MNLSNPFIVNTELFLQCHGSCAGCFLSSEERLEETTYIENIKLPLLDLLERNKNKEFTHFIIGFGRGNLINMSSSSKKKLLELMQECEEIISPSLITYEVSSSLIGKIDFQIQEAVALIKKNPRIYFNIVINSEITSKQFWLNWQKFYDATTEERKSWGFSDNWGDILVLNINPSKLPNLDFIDNFFAQKGSPFNISLFPFVDKKISNEDLINLNQWASDMWKKFKDKDLNIKNYLRNFYSINISQDLSDIVQYHQKTEKSYFFIDKNGKSISGSTSIMGEVDYVRLLDKFNTIPEVKTAIIKMQRNKICSLCEYQKECILSGAYLNMLSNQDKIENPKACLSGYQSIFRDARSSFSQISS